MTIQQVTDILTCCVRKEDNTKHILFQSSTEPGFNSAISSHHETECTIH